LFQRAPEKNETPLTPFVAVWAEASRFISEECFVHCVRPQNIWPPMMTLPESEKTKQLLGIKFSKISDQNPTSLKWMS